MYVWRHIPLLRFLIPFVFGIIIANNFNLSFGIILAVFSVLCSALIAGHFYLKTNVKPRLIYGLSIVALLTLFIAGLLATPNQGLSTSYQIAYTHCLYSIYFYWQH